MTLLQYTYDPNTAAHDLILPLLAIPLTRFMSAPALPPTLLKSMILQATLGVAALHSNGIAHRDLNPSNIMLDFSGTLHLIDLGTAYVSNTSWTHDRGELISAVGTG